MVAVEEDEISVEVQEIEAHQEVNPAVIVPRLEIVEATGHPSAEIVVIGQVAVALAKVVAKNVKVIGCVAIAATKILHGVTNVIVARRQKEIVAQLEVVARLQEGVAADLAGAEIEMGIAGLSEVVETVLAEMTVVEMIADHVAAANSIMTDEEMIELDPIKERQVVINVQIN